MTHPSQIRDDAHAPHPERVSESYAEERILEKIARLPAGREQDGLRALSEGLRARDVPPAMRLHLVTAVANLGRIARESLSWRRAPEFED